MRIPLPSPNDCRDYLRTKDAWGTNCFLDREEDDGDWEVVKRPGQVLTSTGTSPGQGVFNSSNIPYKIVNDTFGGLGGGGSWSAATPITFDALGDVNVGSMIVWDGNNFVARVFDVDASYFIFNNSAAGVTFNYLAAYPGTQSSISGFMALGARSGYIFAWDAGDNTKLYRSSNSGVTWGYLSTPPLTLGVGEYFYVLWYGANLYAYNTTTGETCVSADVGATWGSSYAGSGITGFELGAYLVSVNGSNQIIRSNDVFLTYTVISTPPITVLGMIADGTTLYIYNSSYVFYSSTDGVNFTLVGAPAYSFSPIGITIAAGTLYFFETGQMFSLTGGGGGTALSVTTPGLPFDFVQTAASAATPGFFFKSTKDAFYYDGAAVTKVTDPDYPATTVRGVVCLDGTYYVMDANGKIYGSGLNAPLSWNPLNVISAQIEPDGGIYIAKQLNFIVAFGQYTTEFFYDAGNPVGSPLLPYQSAVLSVGCAVAESVVQSNNQIFFMGVVKQKGRSIYALTGTALEPISTPSVERLLNADDLAAVSSFSVKIAGHNFYVITLGTLGITLACDLSTKDWKEWTSLTAAASKSVSALSYSTTTGVCSATTSTPHGYSDGDPVTIAGAAQTEYNGAVTINYVDTTHFTYIPLSTPSVTPATGTITSVGYTSGPFIGKFYTGFGTQDLIQDASGNIYTMDPATYQDNSLPIDVHVRTSLLDGGTNEWKQFKRLQVIGDMAATKVYVRYTGNDYQNWSAYRPVNMANERAMLNRLGRDRRRGFELRHTGNTPLRLEALELIVEKGTN